MDELPPHARALLDAARSVDDPSPAERERVDAAVRGGLSLLGVHLPALDLHVAAPFHADSAEAVVRAGEAAFSFASALKVGIGVLLLSAGAYVALRDGDLSEPPQAQERVAPATATAAKAQEVTPVTLPEVVTVEHVESAPRARAAGSVAASRSRTSVAPRPALAAEAQLIAQADVQLRDGRFDAALRTLGLHAQRFPSAGLSEERAALRVLALCGKGASARALRERERFLRASPASVLASRVASACAADGAPWP
jgi:hypothetical protein